MAPQLPEAEPSDATMRARVSLDLAAHPTGTETESPHGHRGEVDTQEVDRLVRLTFAALLGREPDRDTMLAYREGFANGSTFRDLVDDVVGSDEYRDVSRHDRQRRVAPAMSDEATPGDDCSADLEATAALLAARLAEKGCRLPFRPLTGASRGDCVEDGRRMRSLLATLSVLDRL